ncbi:MULTISPECIES: hypothetical protein [unclassified Campylobacter]|uniref:hypothetical protein n=1 Tax=unclassified Campylobacter TaxID=2593542 RepID=UPI0022E9A000|nr:MULTISPECIES: hypothetical protein [unclassified Campylobacter]MDA3054043.1 hypothetical protein [Campylobacter sp. VBCF_07 NA4]MDA3060070.1 hypothetical protein [Campylobacter sp. VBCF_02 NA5]MDA3069584.1 hypothetical protein [Campylobacter sp. VBCF_08 NA3]
MRKILILLGICGALNASNFDNLKIETVKKIYQNQENFDKICGEICTNSLKIAFLKDEEFANGEIGCLDYDPTISGQDICDNPEYKFEILKFGDVEVEQICKGWTPESQKIIYKLECGEDDCKISDIYNTANYEGKDETFSVKEMIYDCLKTYQKEKK